MPEHITPAAPAPAPGGHSSLEVVAVLPWVVLAELDGLKSAEKGDGTLAAAARSALAKLRAAIGAGCAFFRGQSLAEFREAGAKHGLGLPPKMVTPDDRILQCCLQYKVRGVPMARPPCVMLVADVSSVLRGTRLHDVAYDTIRCHGDETWPPKTGSMISRASCGRAHPNFMPATGLLTRACNAAF